MATLGLAGFVVAAIVYALLTGTGSSSLSIDSDRISVDRVQVGEFEEYVPITGRVQPKITVYLDLEEGGIVEQIFIESGNWVDGGDLILGLSNTMVQKNNIDSETRLLENLDSLRNSRISARQQGLILKGQMLDLLGLIDNPSSGSYNFLGEELGDYSESRLAKIRKTNIGFVFQSFNLIEELTVFENVELPLIYNGAPRDERSNRVAEVLDKMDMSHRMKHFPLPGAVARWSPTMIDYDTCARIHHLQARDQLSATQIARQLRLDMRLSSSCQREAEGRLRSAGDRRAGRRAVRVIDGELGAAAGTAAEQRRQLLPLATQIAVVGRGFCGLPAPRDRCAMRVGAGVRVSGSAHRAWFRQGRGVALFRLLRAAGTARHRRRAGVMKAMAVVAVPGSWSSLCVGHGVLR